MSAPNLPNPYIPSTQWTLGEGLDDLKMHRRVDEPLDYLAQQFLQSWSTQWASFFVRLSSGTAIPATAANSVPFNVPVIDTANAWTPPGGGFTNAFYTIPWDGQYISGFQLTQNSPTSQMQGVINFSDGVLVQSPLKNSVTGISTGISIPRRLTAGTTIFVWSEFAFTPDVTASFIANYFFVQQIGW